VFAGGAPSATLLEVPPIRGSFAIEPEWSNSRRNSAKLPGDDVLDGRWVGWVAQALVAWRATAVIARQCRGSTAATGSVQQYPIHDSSS